MPTGTDLIRADHRLVSQLFEQFTATDDASLIGQIIDALSAHDQAEHAALYPLAGAVLHDADLIARYEVDHMIVKRQIDELRSLEGEPLRLAAEALRLAVEEHATDEEDNLLPALERAATADQLEGLAARIEQNKQRLG
jgi:hemerythrin superfamily protein